MNGSYLRTWFSPPVFMLQLAEATQSSASLTVQLQEAQGRINLVRCVLVRTCWRVFRPLVLRGVTVSVAVRSCVLRWMLLPAPLLLKHKKSCT